MTVAVYLYPWDADGDPAAADRIAGLGVTEVSLAAVSHAVRAVTPFPSETTRRHQGRGCLLPPGSGPVAGRRVAAGGSRRSASRLLLSPAGRCAPSRMPVMADHPPGNFWVRP